MYKVSAENYTNHKNLMNYCKINKSKSGTKTRSATQEAPKKWSLANTTVLSSLN